MNGDWGVPIRLIKTEELAALMGYSSANSAFREWLVSLRITPVPGRRGYYDPLLVRRRLDEAQGLATVEQSREGQPVDLVAQRRARRGSK
ncbi:hypothetical protein [Rhodovulum imhoffii]|uniref:hypothetical protein n=1 Tax=Rhodovulum imhoffii TaxID=365340 RepID=UPI0011B1F170|nr:hypothetical protein [Rhodovulum imhoffii]